MKKARTFIPLVLTVAGMATVAVSQQPVQLQPGDVKIKKIEVIAQPTPIFQADGIKNKNIPNQREWLEVEHDFKIERGRNDKDAVVSELTFRYYVAFQDTTGKYVLLTGDMVLQNMALGEDYYAAVYVPPTTHGKITGSIRRLDMGKMKGVGVEVFYNGVKVGQESTTKTAFWEAPTMSRQPGVLSKDKTPFSILWLDRYAEIKP